MTFKILKIAKITIFTNTILNKKLVVSKVGDHSVYNTCTNNDYSDILAYVSQTLYRCYLV